MDLAQFSLILKARWRVIALAVLIGSLLGAAWVLVSPRRYLASAQLLLSIRAPDTVGTELLTPQMTPDYLSTQADIIRSDRVALAVVKALHLADDPQTLAQYRAAGGPGTVEGYIADRLEGALSVAPSATSRVLSVGYIDNDPIRAATIANAFADAYQSVSLDLTIDPAQQSAHYFQKSADEVSKQLGDAQTALAQRRAALGVTSLNAESSDADDARLAGLSQQLAAAQAADATQNSRASNGAMPDVMASSVVAGMQTDLARLEAQRKELATYAGPNNLDYIQLTNQISQLRKELANQTALVAKTSSVAAAQSAGSVAALQKAVDAQRSRVIASQRARGELAALEQRVASLRDTYNQIMSRQAQTKLLATTNQTNVTLLAPAVPPTSPSNKPAILKFLACFIAGLIIGVATAVIKELLDQRMRRPDDAGVWLGIPNLGGVRMLEPPAPRAITSTVRRYLPGPNKAN